MPYTMATLPDSVKKLPEKRQRQWFEVWNSAYRACEKDGGKDCEASAFRQANGVVLSEGGPSEDLAVVAFALDAPTEAAGEFVIRKGKLFEAGSYPDKAFEMTPEELAAAAAAFAPVPIDLEHVPTVLDGKLGEVRAVEVADDGKTLLGTVALPTWLDAAIGDAERKVSCTWNRATKRLERLALVRTPRVTDAALMAAFAESEAEFIGRRNSGVDQSRIQGLHDVAIDLGASCRAPMGQTGRKESKRMGTWDTIKAWIQGGMEGEPNVTFGAGAGTPPEPADTPPEPAQPDPEKVALQARIATLEAEGRQGAAGAFADAMIAAKKALPAEKPAIVAAFARAAEDDAVSPAVVTFGEGKTGGRVDALRALYEARQPHILTLETLPPDLKPEQILAAFNAPRDPATVDDERRRQLLAASPVGQGILAEKNGKGA